MENFWEIQLSGSGGQGMVLAGLILAEAGIHAGKNAVQTQTFGPEARGGASKAEVIIADEEIDYPKVQEPDFLLAMSQEAFDKYGPATKGKDSIILIDSSFVTDFSKVQGRVVSLPLTEMAEKNTGRAVVANMVALGALVGLTGVVPEQSLIDATMERIPKGTEELNMKALQLGLEAVKKLYPEGFLTVAL